VTMILGGLWHGAAWTFVLWGVWHGFALAIERSVHERWQWRRMIGLGRTLTLAIVLFGWVLFRSPNLEVCGTVFQRLLWPHSGIDWFPPLVLAAMGCMIAEHIAWRTRLRHAMRLPWDRWYSPIATAVMVWCLVLYAPRGLTPFVYFQF